MKNFDLVDEANFFNHQVFSGKLTPEIISQYVKAHEFVLKSPAVTIKKIDLSLIIDKSLDLEAIEYALRLKFRDNLITKKIHILSYLLEANRDYNSLYFNEKAGFLKGFIILGYHVVRSCYLFIKGSYLINRYNLV